MYHHNLFLRLFIQLSWKEQWLLKPVLNSLKVDCAASLMQHIIHDSVESTHKLVKLPQDGPIESVPTGGGVNLNTDRLHKRHEDNIYT